MKITLGARGDLCLERVTDEQIATFMRAFDGSDWTPEKIAEGFAKTQAFNREWNPGYRIKSREEMVWLIPAPLWGSRTVADAYQMLQADEPTERARPIRLPRKCNR